MKSPTLTLIDSFEDALSNIKHFHQECFGFDKQTSGFSVATLVENIPYYRAWYCNFDENTGQNIFAPSKYIGYQEMNAECYALYNRTGLDGRKTEGVLATWFETIDASHPQYAELYKEFCAFCKKFEKTPNSLFRLNIIKKPVQADELEDDVCQLLFKVYKGLSAKNQATLKQKILQFK